jgi:hypothetical protein
VTDYVVRLIGCEDETRLTVNLTPEEVILLDKIEKLSREASEYDCMPILVIENVIPPALRALARYSLRENRDNA